jgi:outer membrane protein
MIAIMLLVLGMSGAVWAELKIGYVSSKKIFDEYEGVKQAQEKFDKEVAKWRQQAAERGKEIQELREQLEKQSLLLSEERKKEIEKQLQEKMAEYYKWEQKLYQEEIQKKNTELSKPLVEKINKILEKIAEKENYDYIFDGNAGGLVYAKPEYDLTDRVLKELRKQRSGK